MTQAPIKTSDLLYAMAQGIELTVREDRPLDPAFAAGVVATMRAVARDLVQPVTVVVPGRHSAPTAISWLVATVNPGGSWRGVACYPTEEEARKEARNARRRYRVRK